MRTVKMMALGAFLGIVGCGGKTTAPGETSAATTADEELCRQAALHEYDGERDGGVAEDSAQKRFLVDLARCSGDASRANYLRYAGLAAFDQLRAARLLMENRISPAAYLALVRDRTRKVRRVERSDSEVPSVLRDTDGDLVPDSADRCPRTPALTATNDQGCPIQTLPAAPDAQLVQQALHGTRVMIGNGSCDGAPVPGTPTGVSIGYDHAWFGGGACTPESSRDLCYDGVDNNCNGLIDEGCPGATPANGEIVVAPVTDQPASCLVFYEIDGVATRADGSRAPAGFHMVFRSTEGTRDAAGNLHFLVPPGAGGGRGSYYDNLRYYDQVQWHVQAMNGNGLASGFTPLVGARPRHSLE